ncbi:Helitron helicase [Phytophthora megakarya]|uniref:Helitron helicase n=1 Tax=Phytophthora megakarya TaxID=4795 RepID=A0A225UKY2_9STRA|nr:Helitron helicase [Phytophthora megakarya]
MFSGLHDLMLADHALMRATPDLQNTGTHIILSPSFKGGVRYMRQQYYDSMDIVRQFGKPDLFITVTTNPNWPEIKGNLLPGQTASDRPDIVSRVLKTKLKAILDDITKKKGFGDTEAFVYVIEFQKRGLPHAHILVILKGESKPKTSADYDKIKPIRNFLRLPCTGEDGKCSKRFPKAFVDETGVDGDGYPVYRRRHPGPVKSASSQGSRLPTTVRFVSKRVQTPMARGRRSRREAVVVDNRWVVPYNPYLCQKYNCHVNMEICSTVQSVKYLYKYVYKGQDRATVTLRPHQQDTSISSENDGGADRDSIDEIQQYLDGRYLSPPEACWTIFKYDMQEKSHHVHQLPVHEEGKQLVHYSTTAAIQDIIEYNQFTKLTACVEWIQPKVQLPENYFIMKYQSILSGKREGIVIIGPNAREAGIRRLVE